MKSWIPILLCVLTYFSIQAQNQPVGEHAIQDSSWSEKVIPEVIVSGNRISPVTVTRIGRKEIANFQGPSIEPLLNQQPGIWMQTGALNTNRISIRGTGYREPFATSGIKVYWDEFPITNGAGESNIEDIHPRMFQEINIYKGPSSALWGQGLGGMIHFVSNKPDSTKYETRIGGGSFGRFQLDQQLALKANAESGLGALVHYQFLTDDGYRSNNHYRKHSATFLPGLARDKFYLQGLFHLIDLKAGLPSSINLTNFMENPWKAEANWESVGANENYTRIISGVESGVTLNRSLSYKGSLFTQTSDLDEIRPFNVITENTFAYGTRQRILGQSQRWNYSGGFEFQQEKYRNETFETLEGGASGEKLGNQSEVRTYLSLFAQTTYSFSNRLILFAGMSSHLSALKYEDQQRNIPMSLFPAVSLTWLPSSFLEFKGMVSRGYTPLTSSNLIDSYGFINRQLIPETGWNEEISMETKVVTENVTLVFSLATYALQVMNTILVERFEENHFRTYNGGESKTFGLEASASLYLKNANVEWRASYTWNDSRFGDFIGGNPQIKGSKLPGIPEHRMFHRITWPARKPGVVYAEYYMTGKVILTDLNDVLGKGSNVFNLGGSYSFNVNSRNFKIDAQLVNVFNLKYASMFQINSPGTNPRYYYPGRPRTFYLTLIFELS